MAKKSKDVITIERARRVWRGKEKFFFPNCDHLELSMLFDIAEKRKAKDHEAAASALRFLKIESGSLLEWDKVEEALRILERHTVIKGNTVYDKLADGRLTRRYA